MARIKTVEPEEASGLRRLLVGLLKRQYQGFLPGVFKVMLVDLKVGRLVGNLYDHLHLRKNSPLTRLHREMVATVVNGAVGGAP